MPAVKVRQNAALVAWPVLPAEKAAYSADSIEVGEVIKKFPVSNGEITCTRLVVAVATPSSWASKVGIMPIFDAPPAEDVNPVVDRR